MKKRSPDYDDFLAETRSVTPMELDTQVKMKIHRQLNWSVYTVFFKLTSLHFFFGFLSLAVCHQFEINPFQTTFTLSDYFMKFGGHHFCMFACGLFFTSVTYLVASVLLSSQDLVSLRKHVWLHNISLASLSLFLFTVFGADFVVASFLLWFVGSVAGGVTTLILNSLKDRSARLY